jgi:bifunctional UDP-N-acetylglucosamine pyrophosphorylase/glucosamine-1-phosphate N-acetyltransferase
VAKWYGNGFWSRDPRFESWHLRLLEERRSTISGVASIVLAGGKGVRMKSDLPKVLHPFFGKPLISHVLDSLARAGVDDIYVVVGYRGDKIIDAIKGRATPVWQHEQLGTGHAVMQARSALDGFSGRVIVACGDVPLLRPETFRMLIDESRNEEIKAVVLTMALENPSGYGRVKKDAAGNFLRIIEDRDASPVEREIHEVNTGTYIFDKVMLFEELSRIDTDNAQGEYYLPDVLSRIRSSGFAVKTLTLSDFHEGSGVNTKEELEELEEYWKNSERDGSKWATVC